MQTNLWLSRLAPLTVLFVASGCVPEIPGGGGGSGGGPGEAARDVVVVGNSVSGTVNVLDGHTFENLGHVDVIPDLDERIEEIRGNLVWSIGYNVVRDGQLVKHFEPSDGDRYVDDVMVSPDGTTLYVSRSNLADVAAFDLADPAHPMLWRTRVTGFKADHAALSPDGRRIVVSATSAAQADVLDAATGEIVGDFDTGTYPHQNDFSPDGERIYNASLGLLGLDPAFQGQHHLSVVDAETLEVLRIYDFDVGIRPAVFTPDEKIMYAQLSFLNGFIRFDLESGEITDTVELPFSDFALEVYVTHEDLPHESMHHGLALSGDGKTLCSAGTIDNYVAMVSTETLEATHIVDVGLVPYWATTSHDGRSCIVSISGADEIHVLDFATGDDVARTAVGVFPQRNRLARMPASVISGLD
jgi:DNA-binding beta-propeller fold protein YncE